MAASTGIRKTKPKDRMYPKSAKNVTQYGVRRNEMYFLMTYITRPTMSESSRTSGTTDTPANGGASGGGMV